MLELVDLSRGLALAVAAVHRRGIVHRDVNPRNILLSGKDRRPILVDFDLATAFAENQAPA